MSRRVLIVDDDSRFRELVRMLLERDDSTYAQLAEGAGARGFVSSTS